MSLKLCDKFGLILRLQTTVNDVSFSKHYREVEHRNGIREKKGAPRRKSSYSLRQLLAAAKRRYLEFLAALRQLLAAAKRRYLEFLAALEDLRAGVDKLGKLSRTVRKTTVPIAVSTSLMRSIRRFSKSSLAGSSTSAD